MLTTYNELKDKITDRIYNIISILSDNSETLTCFDTDYLSEAILTNFHTIGDMVKVYMVWEDYHDNVMSWEESYMIPVALIEAEDFQEEEVLSHWKEENTRLKIEHKKETIRDLICSIGANKDLTKDILLEFENNKDFTSKEYINLVEKLSSKP